MKKTTAFAEVIQSSLHSWVAQSWQWNQFPSFGSLVAIETNNRTLFGVVHQINTGSMDPSRYPFAYQKTYEELMAEQPQIFEFLKTTFACITVGYQEKGKIYYLSAPEPAPIHAFVSPMTPETCRQFFASERYLHLVFAAVGQLYSLDELLLALLKHQANLGTFTNPDRLTSFIEQFCLLTGNDYRRLKLFLQRAEAFI